MKLEDISKEREIALEKFRLMNDEDAYCPTCGNDYSSKFGVIRHHSVSHDFKICKNKFCVECGDRFKKTSKNHVNKFCSRECYGDSRYMGDIEIECDAEDCSNTRELKMWQYNKSDTNYCSYKCMGKSKRGDNYNIRNSGAYQRWTKEIHNSRDDCAECGKTEKLQAHHIIPVSEDETLATDTDNGILLCAWCHADKHPELPEGVFINS